MKALFSIVFALAAAVVFGQDLRLGIYPIKPVAGLTTENLASVRSKITALVAANGVASADPAAPLGVQADLVLNEPRTVSAGISNLVVLEGEVILSVRQGTETGAIIGSKSRKISGSGRDLAQARSSLVANFPTGEAVWGGFFNEIKPKAADFFNKNCSTILADAERDATTGKYERALSALVNVPSGTTCRAEADAKLAATYSRAREVICQKNLTAARAAAAIKNYPAAAAALKNIDPEAACFADAKAFVAEMQQKADADFRTELEALTELWKAQSSFDNRRLEVIQDFLKGAF